MIEEFQQRRKRFKKRANTRWPLEGRRADEFLRYSGPTQPPYSFVREGWLPPAIPPYHWRFALPSPALDSTKYPESMVAHRV